MSEPIHLGQSVCRARPDVEDKRTCELSAGHDGTHRISGVATDKFGEHVWSLTWHDGSYGAVSGDA